MWMFTTHGFVSAVQHPDSRDTMVLRFRCREHAENFRRIALAVDGNPTVTDRKPDADYLYRFEVNRDAWEGIVAEVSRRINYDSFRVATEVAVRRRNERDAILLKCLHEVWETMAHYQSIEEFDDSEIARHDEILSLEGK